MVFDYFNVNCQKVPKSDFQSQFVMSKLIWMCLIYFLLTFKENDKWYCYWPWSEIAFRLLWMVRTLGHTETSNLKVRACTGMHLAAKNQSSFVPLLGNSQTSNTISPTLLFVCKWQLPEMSFSTSSLLLLLSPRSFFSFLWMNFRYLVGEGQVF